MKSIREHIYLSALLHDIGKFYQRADNGSINSSKFLKGYCKDESTFCPQKLDGTYTHKHVLWTAQFIEDNTPVFKNLINSDISDLSNRDNLINLATGHHLKDDQISALGKIIQEANCLSSGIDLSSDEALKDSLDKEINCWDSFKKKRMISILETINNDTDVRNHLPVYKMTLSDDIFPKKEFSEAPNYSSLWNDFITEFKFIQANTYRAFSETLLNLLYKYTTSIPSSTINFPDVSLYDHLKTTAALAICLYDVSIEKNAESRNEFILIGADFSGIQSYIYQIVSKYAGKNLKGRSFYLRILSDAIARYILLKLDLFQANIIYNSGGSFYIIAPNTKHVKEKLAEAIAQIEKKLFNTHGTDLYVAIDYVEFSKDALLHSDGQCLNNVWDQLFNKRELKKSTKFASLIKDNYSSFFSPILMGGDVKRDSITGEEFLPNEKVISESGLLLKYTSDIQIKIGKKLKETNIIVIKEGEPFAFWDNCVHITPLDLGITYYFIDSDDELSRMKDKLSVSADEVTVITLNGKNGNCDFLHSINGINNIYGFEFYGGNEIGTNNTFEEMCKNDNLTRMGVLRMDVDNLGSIFKDGIPPQRATLSRYASLSRAFDYFFSGYLNTIWKETDPDHSFIIYSGGDDVFIVGKWNTTITLAQRIKEDFSSYTCNNKAFSISGGIAIIPPKYPIMKGAEESAHEESNAKKHQCNGVSKNSISFLGTAFNWDYEFKQVKSLKETLCKLLENNNLPKSFLSKIMMHYSNANIIDHNITHHKTYWMLTYDLTRLKERTKSPSIKALIDRCITEVCNKSCGTLNGEAICTQYHPLELWNFAARWAELEYRNNKDINN